MSIIVSGTPTPFTTEILKAFIANKSPDNIGFIDKEIYFDDFNLSGIFAAGTGGGNNPLLDFLYYSCSPTTAKFNTQKRTASELELVINNSNVIIYFLRAIRNHANLTKMVFEVSIISTAAPDPAIFEMGWTDTDTRGGIRNNTGYGLLRSSGSWKLYGYNAQTQAMTIAMSSKKIYRLELNMSSGVPDSMDLYEDGTLNDSLAGLSEQGSTQIPYIFLSHSAACSFFIDYVKIWGE